MPMTTNEEQFKFLISCIRWSNNGKVDFSEVAKECKIVSKGAAAKRYERMMKAHGIAPSGSSTTKVSTPSRRVKRERHDASVPTPACKKTKTMDHFANGQGAGEDDQEDFSTPGFVKPEPTGQRMEDLLVKEEPGQVTQLHHFLKAQNPREMSPIDGFLKMQYHTEFDIGPHGHPSCNSNGVRVSEASPGVFIAGDSPGPRYRLQPGHPLVAFENCGSSSAGIQVPLIRRFSQSMRLGEQESIVIVDEDEHHIQSC